MINYPTKRKPYQNKTANNNANKGMAIEEMISVSNTHYANFNIAYINKRPTPVKVLKTEDYYKITEGVFLQSSTLDFVGVYKGRYLDFEAKETNSTKGFPMANIPEHQIQAMEKISKLNGLSFAIIYLKAFNEIYFLDSKYLIEAFKNKKTYIVYEDIKQYGVLIKEGYNTPCDYLKAVDEYYK